MKKLNKHFNAITKKVGAARPALKNVVFSPTRHTAAATDAYRLLEYNVGYNGENELIMDLETLELFQGHYPDLSRLIRTDQCMTYRLSVDKIKAIHASLKANKKDNVLMTTSNDNLKLKYMANDFAGLEIPVSEKYDTDMHTLLTVEYLFGIFDFLIDYVKEYKDADIIMDYKDSLKALQFSDKDTFVYLIQPHRER